MIFDGKRKADTQGVSEAGEPVLLKIHRPALPDGVRTEEMRGTRKTPEAARPLAFSLARGK
jgi:hypothetical protein